MRISRSMVEDTIFWGMIFFRFVWGSLWLVYFVRMAEPMTAADNIIIDAIAAFDMCIVYAHVQGFLMYNN